MRADALAKKLGVALLEVSVALVLLRDARFVEQQPPAGAHPPRWALCFDVQVEVGRDGVKVWRGPPRPLRPAWVRGPRKTAAASGDPMPAAPPRPATPEAPAAAGPEGEDDDRALSVAPREGAAQRPGRLWLWPSELILAALTDPDDPDKRGLLTREQLCERVGMKLFVVQRTLRALEAERLVEELVVEGQPSRWFVPRTVLVQPYDGDVRMTGSRPSRGDEVDAGAEA